MMLYGDREPDPKVNQDLKVDLLVNQTDKVIVEKEVEIEERAMKGTKAEKEAEAETEILTDIETTVETEETEIIAGTETTVEMEEEITVETGTMKDKQDTPMNLSTWSSKK